VFDDLAVADPVDVVDRLTEEAQATIADDVCTKLIKFVNVGITTGAVNVPEVELPEQGRGLGREEESEEGAGETRQGTAGPDRLKFRLHFHPP